MLEKIRDYAIIKRLGEGGMGTVYLANDVMLERKVAIKVLNPLLTKDSQFTERFRHEAKVQASLIHSNIVTLYNYFFEQDHYCMVMEYIEGVTLKQLITNTGPMPEQKAVWILNQMLDAVGYAHKKGIIHRDIKPSNVLIAGDNTVKILDFGIAKILQDKGMTKTGTKMGTIFYMSPEQIRAVKDIDNRTDIYSLGVTFYEMLSGKVPFNVDTESDFEIMNEIVSGEIKDPRIIYPHISDWVVDVLFASVEKDRNKRIQSTDEFIERLLSKEGKSSVKGTPDKTVIDHPSIEPVQIEKTTIAQPPPPKPQQPPAPVRKEAPSIASVQPQVKKSSSGNKKVLFGVLGLIAAVVIIYFAAFNNSSTEPVNPDDPSITTNSDTTPDEYEKKFLEGTKNINDKIRKPDTEPTVKTKRRYGRGMPGRTSKPTAAH